MLLRPMPPTPMPATLTVSLGAWKPTPPSTCRGTIVTPAAAMPAVWMNLRRGIC